MKELQQAVATAFENVVSSGAIEAAIEEKLGQTIIKIIEQQMSSYGDFGEALKARIDEALNIDLREITLPSYGDLIGKIVRTRIDGVMHKEFSEAIDAHLGKLLSPAPAQITLDKLIDDYIESKKDYGGGMLAGHDFTFAIESQDYGYWRIGIDQDPGQELRRCGIQIAVTREGCVYSLDINGKDLKERLFVGPLFNFERALFQMYTAKTKLIIPEGASADDYPTRFPYPGEDD
jgi:hypothetical protein